MDSRHARHIYDPQTSMWGSPLTTSQKMRSWRSWGCRGWSAHLDSWSTIDCVAHLNLLSRPCRSFALWSRMTDLGGPVKPESETNDDSQSHHHDTCILVVIPRVVSEFRLGEAVPDVYITGMTSSGSVYLGGRKCSSWDKAIHFGHKIHVHEHSE